MGQTLSCTRSVHEQEFFAAAHSGDAAAVASILLDAPCLLYQTTIFDRLSILHIAAANGHLELLSMLLDRSLDPDLVNRQKQTPLMLAARQGKIACVQRLLHAGANILMLDSVQGRNCLHYAAYHGHSDCLLEILAAAHTTPVADSWGFARFVNVRDGNDATPLHLASRQRRPDCVHILLENGAFVGALTAGYGCPGSSPLHLAARGGCLDSVRELLAWGADRLQIDSSGRIPYSIALKRNHGACAALLNPSSAEQLVWPTPLKFIRELNPETKLLLETALMEANREREKILKGTAYASESPMHPDGDIDDDVSEDNDADLCCICFDQVCTIEVQDCGHQMCAHCTLSLCCHNLRNATTPCLPAPVCCPFCRSSIARLVVAKTKPEEEGDKDHSSKLRMSRRSRNLSEGSSSFKGLSSAMGSFGRMGGRGSGRIVDNSEMMDKQ